ncbi:MAG: macrolide ABC transporter ATP-binding protein, partial [Alphaproteobacteria bacterium]
MELLTDLNCNSDITVLMVTHESDMAAYARTIIHFRDGLVERIETGKKA